MFFRKLHLSYLSTKRIALSTFNKNAQRIITLSFMSNFKNDLNKEQLLGKYLDEIYKDKGINFTRVYDISKQHSGIDLEYTHKNDNIFYLDEKAQLDYINKDLPTFAFELSYLKSKKIKEGWLFDKTKLTTHYLLITSIYSNDINLKNGISSCKITSVSRNKLINHLKAVGLNKPTLLKYDEKNRSDKKQKTTLNEISLNQGYLFYSAQKSEKPINLILKLQYLIDVGVAKKINY